MAEILVPCRHTEWLTVSQYEEIVRNIMARHMVGATDFSDSVLAALLKAGEYEYNEAKAKQKKGLR